jgi:trehalose 6-phosphate phosphatase
VDRALQPLADRPRHGAVLVDFDGSLAPIVDDPEAATALPAARDALASLVGRFALVGVVSGRPVAFLRRALALDGISYVGQYGIEREESGTAILDPRAVPFVAVIEDVADAATGRFPGLLVERKQIAVTLHWRTSPQLEAEVDAWAHEIAAANGLIVLPGRQAAELRPPIPVDKGAAVADMVRGLHAALFAGDDVGDVAAWDALDGLVAEGALAHAVKVGVRSPEEPPEIVARADVHVDGPPGLAVLLNELGDALRP